MKVGVVTTAKEGIEMILIEMNIVIVGMPNVIRKEDKIIAGAVVTDEVLVTAVAILILTQPGMKIGDKMIGVGSMKDMLLRNKILLEMHLVRVVIKGVTTTGGMLCTKRMNRSKTRLPEMCQV